MLYSSMSISTKHQHESTIGLSMCPPTGTRLPPPYPSHPSRLSQSHSLNSLSHTANSHWLSILHMVMYVSILLSPYVPPSPSFPHPSHVLKSLPFMNCSMLHLHGVFPKLPAWQAPRRHLASKHSSCLSWKLGRR